MGVEKSVQELATMVQEVNGGSVEMRHGPTGQGGYAEELFHDEQSAHSPRVGTASCTM
jgi:hypothetical protein